MSIHKKAKNLKPDAVAPAPLIVSVVRYDGPVGKPYGYKKGKLTKGVNYRSKKAVGETLEFYSFGDFKTWRRSLTSETMLVSGTFAAVGEVLVAFKDEEGPGEVSASKKYLEHREQPGILIGDIDFKDPYEVAGLYLGGEQPYNTQDEALSAFDKVLPEADDCALLIGNSTSSNLFKGKKKVKGTGGMRFYLPVKDASKIPELLNIMLKRSWLRGEGWAFVDEAGKFQERGLVDTALERPTQPDYAAPDLSDGLTQDREWDEFDGDYLDPASVAPLTAEEEEQYQQAIASAKDALAPEMAAQRDKWLAKEAKKHETKGLKPKRAMSAAVQLLDNGVLFPSGSVIFDDGTEVSVLDLLTDGASHDGKTCKDPVEPDYREGASVGIFYWNDGDRPGIHSFAHGSRWYAIKYDVDSLLNMEWGDAPDMEDIIAAAAVTEFASASERKSTIKKLASNIGLGNAFKSLEQDIDKKIADNAASVDPSENIDPRKAKVVAGLWPHEKPLPRFVWSMVNEEGAPLVHLKNIEVLLDAYGIALSYNVILKDWDWTFQGVDRGTDNADGSFFTNVRDLIKLNGLSVNAADAMRYLITLADARQENPVTDYLSVLFWDGKDRITALATALKPHNQEIAEISLRRALIQACAAADGAVLGRLINPSVKAVFEYVLAFLSGQGAGKTKGLAHLVPDALAPYVKTSVVLDIGNKDSVKGAVGGWICELGELDASYSKAAQTAFKAFMSREEDELRLPYAATHSRFKRRTAFIGTVNEPDFLRDQTGSRRFLPLAVGAGFPRWPAYETDQLWAQVWAAYVSGEQWWPTDGEVSVLVENAETFRQRSGIEEALLIKYDWESCQPKNGERRMVSQIASMFGDRYATALSLRETGYALSNLWRKHGAVEREGQLKIKTEQGWVKVNANSGKNMGWLLPPQRLDGSPDIDDDDFL